VVVVEELAAVVAVDEEVAVFHLETLQDGLAGFQNLVAMAAAVVEKLEQERSKDSSVMFQS